MRNGVIRFSLKACLILVATMAALAFVGASIQRHRVILKKYERAAAYHEVNRITTAEFLDAVDRLHASERKLPWLSRRQATQLQRERLEDILARQKSLYHLAMTSEEGKAIRKAAIQRIERMLVELEPPSNAADQQAFIGDAD